MGTFLLRLEKAMLPQQHETRVPAPWKVGVTLLGGVPGWHPEVQRARQAG